MKIFSPKVDLRVLRSFVLIPHDPGFGFVTLFDKVISKCCHDQKPINECEDSTDFCLVIVGATHVEAVHRTKIVNPAHFKLSAAPAVGLCKLFSD